MNERIRELAEQAKKYALDAMIKITDKEQALKVYSETYNTTFAELIVKECIDWIDGSPTTEEGSLILSKHFIIANLKHHFGVEE